MSYKPSLLWEIAKEGQETSYLFGTLHLALERFDALQSAIHPYVEYCNICALEINLEQANQFNISEFHSIPAGVNLHDFIPQKKWKYICHKIQKKLSIDLEQMKELQPFIILNFVLQQMFNHENSKVLDEWIFEKAKINAKLITGLEDLEEHYKALHKIPLKVQYNLVFESFSQFSKFEKKMKALIDTYLQQDIRKLYHQAKVFSNTAKNVLLKERNLLMADRFDQLNQQNSVFAAIGAGHLYGQFGLISLLKKKSYRIKPIKININ